MDTPDLPWVEVLAARHSAEKDGKAYICPGAVTRVFLTGLGWAECLSREVWAGGGGSGGGIRRCLYFVNATTISPLNR